MGSEFTRKLGSVLSRLSFFLLNLILIFERIGKRKKENSLENISETSSRFIVVHPRRLEEKPRWRSKVGTKEERMNQDGR